MIFLGYSSVCVFVYTRLISSIFAFLIGVQTIDLFKIRETNKLLNLEYSHCKQLFC